MKLQRSKLIDYGEQWLKNHPNVNDNSIEYISFLDGLNELISKYEYDLDERFFTYGRRDFLRKEFSDYLNERIYCGRGKYNDAFSDLTDYYSGNSWISMSSVPEGLDFREITNADVEYKKQGIICKQEVDIINEMIQEFKEHLKEIKDNNNKDLKEIYE